MKTTEELKTINAELLALVRSYRATYPLDDYRTSADAAIARAEEKQTEICGAYSEHGMNNGKGCGLAKGHEGNHRDA